MRKEVIFAIILGLILGGVILYGIQLANSSAQKAAISSTNQPTPTASVSPTPTASLVITSPQDHSVINTSTIKITGKSLPNSAIALISSEDDILVTADTSGNFNADFKLTGGENVIEISALSPDQKIETTKISVIYTTAKIN